MEWVKWIIKSTSDAINEGQFKTRICRKAFQNNQSEKEQVFVNGKGDSDLLLQFLKGGHLIQELKNNSFYSRSEIGKRINQRWCKKLEKIIQF
jgi:hypothetical protein